MDQGGDKMNVIRKLSMAEKANLIANRTLDLLRQGVDAKTANALISKEYPDNFMKKDIYLVEE
jgi:hypothetical protein